MKAKLLQRWWRRQYALRVIDKTTLKARLYEQDSDSNIDTIISEFFDGKEEVEP